MIGVRWPYRAQRAAHRLAGPDTRLRVALACAVMFGIDSHRQLLCLPDLAEADLDDLLRAGRAAHSCTAWAPG